MVDAITMSVKGIKCDNPECDWDDMNAEFDPEKWLDVPCPKCGANLFTKDAYDQLKAIMSIMEYVNDQAKTSGLEVSEGSDMVQIRLLHGQDGLVNGMQLVGDKNGRR